MVRDRPTPQSFCLNPRGTNSTPNFPVLPETKTSPGSEPALHLEDVTLPLQIPSTRSEQKSLFQPRWQEELWTFAIQCIKDLDVDEIERDKPS